MNNSRKTNIKVGITVVVGTVLLIWVLGWAKNFSFTDNYNLIKVKFNSTSGLSNGDIVTVNGVKSGYVESIKLIENLPFLELKVDKGIKLRKDSKFQIMMLDLMGGKKVEINPGISDEPLDYNIIHNGQFVGDIATAMATLSSVENDIITLIKEVRSAITQMNSSFLSEDFYKDVNSSLENMNILLLQTSNFVADNKGNLSQLISNTDTLVSKGNKLISANEIAIGKSIEHINKFLLNSNELVMRIDKLIEETQSKENNLGKALYDDMMIEDLKRTLNSTNELLKILLEQIKDDGINVDANIF
jgi:phospholipid/cholesterol/gamma-HCH transport system substrate-binding protein